jgi:cytochrome P450
MNDLHVFFFSGFAQYYLLPYERDIQANCHAIRALFQKMVEKRRADPSVGKGDLLSILLSDSLFNMDTEMIIDECLTFFFAGSQTSSIAT